MSRRSRKWLPPSSIWQGIFSSGDEPTNQSRRPRLGVECLEDRIVLSGSGLLVNPQLDLVSKVDQYLTAFENQISIHPFQQKIPVIGNALAQITGANFVEQVRQKVHADLLSNFSSTGGSPPAGTDPVQIVKTALFDALGPTANGLNVIQDFDGNGIIDMKDINVTVVDVAGKEDVRFNLILSQNGVDLHTPFDFSAGFGGLGLSINGNVGVKVNYLWNLGFGVDTKGFYGDTSAPEDFAITATAGLQGLQATGKLGIFQIDVTDSPTAPTGLKLSVALGVTNANLDDHFRLGGQTSLQFNTFHLIGDVNVSLPIVFSINGSDVIPRLRSTLHFEVPIDESLVGPGGAAQIPKGDIAPVSFTLDDVGLNFGSFVTNFLRPATQFLADPLASINFLIDDQAPSVDGTPLGFFYAPLPILQNVSFLNALTPRQILGFLENLPEIGEAIKAFDFGLDALARLNDFVKAVNASQTGGDTWLSFGSFDIANVIAGAKKGPAAKDVGKTGLAATQTKAAPKDGKTQAKDEANSSKEDSATKQLASALFNPGDLTGGPQFTFPILQDPFTIVNLILGNYDNVDLFDFGFHDKVSLAVTLPVGIDNIADTVLQGAPDYVKTAVHAVLDLIPLHLNLSIIAGTPDNPLTFDANLKAGYDASGLAQFVQSKNPADLAKGFFIGSGQIFQVGGTLGISAGIKIPNPIDPNHDILDLSAGGGLNTGLTIDLNDPDNDGKLRFSELEQIIGNDPANLGKLFSVSGNMSYFYNANVSLPFVNYTPVDVSGGGSIYSFDTSGSVGTINADGTATTPSGVTTQQFQPVLASETADGTLFLNMGPKASDRVFGNTTDGDEDFTVTSIGGTAGDETVTVAALGLTQTYAHVHSLSANGGAGNDTITVVGFQGAMNLSGGDGNDTIDVSSSSGPAVIDGGAGDDTLIGGSGTGIIHGGDGNDTIRIFAGNYSAFGDAGNDILIGGSGVCDLHGGAGDDSLFSGTGPTSLYGDDGNDTFSIDRGTSAPIVDGGSGTNTLTVNDVGVAVKIGPGQQGGGAPPVLTQTQSVQATLTATTLTTTTDSGTFQTAYSNISGISLDLGAALTNIVTILDTSVPVIVTGHGPNVTLTVDRSANTADETGVVSANTITGLTTGTITYSGIQTLNVALGSGNNSLELDNPSAVVTAIDGRMGTDGVTVAVTGAGVGTQLQLSKIEKLTVDGTALADTLLSRADWIDDHGVLTVLGVPSSAAASSTGGPLAPFTLFSVDASTVGQTFIRAEQNKGDTLTVKDDTNLPQTVDLSTGLVQIQEGAKILSPSGTLNAPPQAPVFVTSSNAGGNSNAYVPDSSKQLLDTFFRASNTGGNLSLQQQSQGFVKSQTITGTANSPTGAMSVAIDGNLAVIGVPGSGSTLGVAYVYQFDGTNWVRTQVLQPLDRPGVTSVQDGFGSSVAIVAGTIVVGAPHAVSQTTSVVDGGTGQTITTVYQEGAVYVFGVQGDTQQWAQSGKLISADQPTVPVPGSERAFGSAIALTNYLDAFGHSAQFLLVGAPDDSTRGIAATGSAYFFENIGGGFFQAKRVFPPADAPADFQFGSSVAIDGLHAVIGAKSAAGSGTAGAAFVYQRNAIHPVGWQLVTSFTQGADADGFGTAVAISAPGTYASNGTISPAPVDVFVSQPRSQTGGMSGSVYEYHAAADSPTTWTPTVLQETGTSNDGFGTSLALRGSELLVSSTDPHYNPDGKTFTNRGVLHLFQNTDTTGQTFQAQEVARFQTPDDSAYGTSGAAVAFQGNTIFSATAFDGTHRSQVDVFQSSLQGSTVTASPVINNVATIYSVSSVTRSISAFQRDSSGYLTFVQAISQGDLQKASASNGTTVTRTVDGLIGAYRAVVSQDGKVVYVYGTSNEIAVFQRDRTTGKLTFSSVIADPLIAFVSGVKLDASGTNLYVTVPSTGVLVFDLSPNGVWHRIQVIQDGVKGVADLSGPYDLALSPDGKNVYVAATLSNALVTFTRDPITGLLTYQGAKINGQGGVVGLSEETSVVVSPNGKYVFVGGGSLDSVVAFSRNPFSGALTFSQQLVIHSTDPGTSSLPSALSVSDDGKQLYVACGGDLTNGQGGIAWFDIDNTPAPIGVSVGFSGIDSLTVDTGAGDDVVHLNTVTGLSAIAINTGDGGDTVVDQDTAPGQTVAIDLGNGANSFDLRTNGVCSDTTVNGGTGADTFHVWKTVFGSTLTLNGGAGDDLFRVAGTALRAGVTINGGSADTGDTLEFDSTSLMTYPSAPSTPDGSIQIATIQGTPDARSAPVTYTGIETVHVQTVPQADPGIGYTVQEGGSVTLDATASIVPNGPATYVWDINGDGSFGEAKGAKPTLTWAQLEQAGIARSGVYTIRLRVTDAAGIVDEASSTITVVNLTPTNLSVSVNGNHSVLTGMLVPVTATAMDAGGNADVLTYEFDVNNDGVYDVKNTTGTFQYAFGTPGTYIIGARVTDSDGASITSSTTVTVAAAGVRTITGPATVSQNAVYVLALSASGPGTSTISSWTINWGDGAIETVAGNPKSVSHAYTSTGNVVISAFATEPLGTVVSNVVLVSVTPPLFVKPGLKLSGAPTVKEGGPYVLNLAVVPGPHSDTIQSWTINWGDLTTQTVSGDTTKLTHVFKGPASYKISAVAVGVNGTYRADNLVTVAVADVPPVFHVSGPASTNEGTYTSTTDSKGKTVIVPGSAYVLNLSAQTVAVDPVQGWLVNWGDGKVETILGKATSASHLYHYAATPYVIRVGAWDLDNSATNPYFAGTVGVKVNAVAPMLVLGGNASVFQGSPYALALRSFDPAGDGITGWTITWGDGTSTTYKGDPSSVSHTFITPGAFTISAKATKVGLVFAAGNTQSVTVIDPPPSNVQLVLASPVLNEGGSAVLSGSFLDAGSETHAIDVNWGDGSHALVNLAKGVSSFVGLRHTYTDNPTGQVKGSYPISVTVTDSAKGTGSASLSIEVDDVAPTAAVSGPAVAVRGQSLVFTLKASDPSSVDQLAGFAFAINWGDGTSQVITGKSGSTLGHSYDTVGQYGVQITATDKDGVTSNVVTQMVTIQPVALVNGVLTIGGTSGNDTIVVTLPKDGSNGPTGVNLNGSVSSFVGVSRVVVFGQSGDDKISFLGTSKLHVEVHGGNGNDVITTLDGNSLIDLGSGNNSISTGGGNDTVTITGDGNNVIRTGDGKDIVTIRGNGNNVIASGDGNDFLAVVGSGSNMLIAGNGNDILMGGSGNDMLFAGNGRDILIGGLGQDILDGGAGDDILIGGGVKFGSGSLADNHAALDAIMAEWSSSHTYADRVNNLMGVPSSTTKSRLNGKSYLQSAGTAGALATVFDDNSADQLTGSAGQDLFFASMAALLTDAITSGSAKETIVRV